MSGLVDLDVAVDKTPEHVKAAIASYKERQAKSEADTASLMKRQAAAEVISIESDVELYRSVRRWKYALYIILAPVFVVAVLRLWWWSLLWLGS